MSGSQLQVRLYRDSFNTPWGFRLQGGKDLGQPLSIQRVFSNSPAEGELQRGDLILSINDRNANELTHKQAQDLIKFGGGQIMLVINRPGPGRVQTSVTIKPQHPRAPSLQQPPPQSPKTQMPSGGSYAFQPKKVNLSKLGGGGPEFGSDYTAYRPSYTQPVTIQTSAVQRGQQHAEMLNRVQESLDNITLSPRTPDQYQQSPFTSPSSQYIPTGVRIDMEREQELRNKELQQQQQRYQQQQVQQQQVQQQQVQQQQVQQYQFSPQPAYTPTGVRLDQEGQGEEEEEFVPVWERRRAFMNVPSQPSAVPSSKGAPKKIPRPQPSSAVQSFGIDYSKPQPRTTTVTWKPNPVTTPSQETPPPSWKRTEDEPSSAPPAWRETLKSSGVKPWDADLEYSPQLKQAPRSVPFQPLVDKQTFASPQTHTEDGPQVVHLQYNTPIGLYSNENVKETFAGQTQALAAGGPSPGGAPQQGQNPPKPGDRDWTQSAVYRMIHEEERRGRPGPKQQPPTPQQPQQQRGFVPAPPPKPQPAFQQPIKPLDDEYGTSDF